MNTIIVDEYVKMYDISEFFEQLQGWKADTEMEAVTVITSMAIATTSLSAHCQLQQI